MSGIYSRDEIVGCDVCGCPKSMHTAFWCWSTNCTERHQFKTPAPYKAWLDEKVRETL